MARAKYQFLPDLSEVDIRLLDRVSDWIMAADEKYITKFSAFLDERQCLLCEKLMASVKYENYRLWGGYENAARRMLCVYPEYGEAESEDYPITAITLLYRKEDKITHRDILGSLMGLRIKRDSVGDILVGEGKSAVFLRSSVAGEVTSALTKVGRAGVKLREGYDGSIHIGQKTQEISGTVASMRADCILSLAARISREKSAQLIKNVGIEIDHMPKNSPKIPLEEGWTFSVRGYGKFKLLSVDGTTKKDRIHITLNKFV